MTPDQTQLLLLAAGAVVVLVVLIAWLRMNAFLALLLASLVVGLGSRMAPLAMMKAFESGMGGTLGGIAGVLGLGTIYAGLLAASGGADVLAKALIRAFGPKRVHWALMTLALCIGFTTWFAVGLVMLVPILLTLAKETKEPFLKLAIPLLAVLSIMHGVMPPHPGPVFAVQQLGADLGKVILWGLVAAVPVAAISGPIFARWAVKHVRVQAPEPPVVDAMATDRTLPSLAITITVLVVPIALLLVQTIAELVEHDQTAPVRQIASVIGNPTLALGISVIFAGLAFRFTRSQALKIGERAVAAVGMTLLVVGGGGGFKGILEASGAAQAIGDMATVAGLSPMLFGWVCAALVRVATGSATVAIQTACVFAGPVIMASPDVNRELVVVGIGCGSLFLSHLNDAGFWIVKETLGMTVAQTLRTWTVTETLVGVTGLLVAWGLDMVF